MTAEKFPRKIYYFNLASFLWIVILPKLEYFSEIWFQITNPSCSGIRVSKFWLKILIRFGENAIYKSGQLISINWSILIRGCKWTQLLGIYTRIFQKCFRQNRNKININNNFLKSWKNHKLYFLPFFSLNCYKINWNYRLHKNF